MAGSWALQPPGGRAQARPTQDRWLGPEELGPAMSPLDKRRAPYRAVQRAGTIGTGLQPPNGARAQRAFAPKAR